MKCGQCDNSICTCGGEHAEERTDICPIHGVELEKGYCDACRVCYTCG